MIKKNRIVMLVLAAAVLAVITSGSASAATYYYSGTSESYFISSSDYNQLGTSFGLQNVHRGDILNWHVRMFNWANHDLGGQVGGSGINKATYIGDGLFSNNVGCTISTAQPYEVDHPARVAKTGSYYIDDYQCYFDGGRSYTLMFGTPYPPNTKGFDCT
ncbi:hypothetical protein [Methanocella sp. MCL-LM]|uniref:hypothetical protein n=1 Tax=Methanocella sp. MCL-LM TaxID=3412035 RepID=UPI003C71EEA4